MSEIKLTLHWRAWWGLQDTIYQIPVFRIYFSHMLIDTFWFLFFDFFITVQVRTRDHPKVFVFKYAPSALIRWFTVYIYTISSCFPLSELISIARIKWRSGKTRMPHIYICAMYIYKIYIVHTKRCGGFPDRFQ